MQKTSPLLTIAVLLLFSPGAARAELPAEAKTAVQQGLDAVRQRDYETAERFFQEARAKGGAEAYYAIGLAESKIPGRELRAVCWLAAYLAADPKAANAAEVKGVIDALDTKSRGRIAPLLQALQDAVVSMPDGQERNYAMRDAAGQWAAYGDFDAAKKVIALMNDRGTRADALENLACTYTQQVAKQVEAGEMAEARKSLEEAKTAAGRIDFGSAEEAQYYVAVAWIQIAKGQLREGDFKGVQASLDTAQVVNAPVKSPGSRNDIIRDVGAMQVAVAKAQLAKGDAAGAKESLAAALKTADDLNGPQWPWKLGALEDIAEAQIQENDLAGARATLAAALPVARDDHALHAIALMQVRAGDAEVAKQTAELIKDAGKKAKTLGEIAEPPKNGAAPMPTPPLPSDMMQMGSGSTNVETWVWLLQQNLDAPCFTAFADLSDFKAIAAEIQKEPVMEGIQMRQDIVLEGPQALSVVARRMAGEQQQVDRLLKIQFKK